MKRYPLLLALALLPLAGKAQMASSPQAIEPQLGPYLQFTAPGEGVVRWRTAEAMPSVLEYGEDGALERVEDAMPKTEHVLTLTGLKHNTVYRYRVVLLKDGAAVKTPGYECDTTFNYTLPPVPEADSPYPEDALTPVYRAAAERIVAATGITRGYAVVVGCGQGRLAYELARRTRLHLVGVDTDEAAVEAARAAFRQMGLYGSRATFRQVDALAELPYTKFFANLVVSDRMLTDGAPVGDAAEFYRLIRPAGGVALIGQIPETPNALTEEALTRWLQAGGVEFETLREGGLWARLTRPPIAGAGQWPHQYGTPDNSGRSHETLGGATGTDQMQVQWLGRPGPRAMVDRNPRKPSPLYINGRLFTQGLHRIIAQDVYNGAILWSLDIPRLQRFNMPRDCSNWCADEDFLYVAIDGDCWRIDAATGALDKVYPVRAPGQAAGFDWGYVAQVDGVLYGSAVKAGTVYTNFRGGSDAGWYDAKLGKVTYKVCSDALFALSKATGEVLWTYAGGLVVNPTITMAEDTFYFVECRDGELEAAPDRRIDSRKLARDWHLVAIDVQNATQRWEHPLDIERLRVVLYLLHANDTLVIAGSEKKYHLYGFDAKTGERRWQASHDWTGSDHSGHMQRPVVAGNTVFLEPCGYDLRTGERVTDQMGRHEGCATYMAIEGALIYRGAGRQIALWDVTSGRISTWNRLRPGCWLSTVAGAGMVLSPEAGGGCSCGNWMETSITFIPKEM